MTNVTILPSKEVEGELTIVRGIAKAMDELVSVPGTKVKFGLDSIIGLIPGVGDVGSAAISAYLLRAASRLGVPVIVQLRMMMNILFDAILGLVPFIGDFLDVLYKANAKNAKLIVQSVENRETTGRSSWFIFVGMILLLIAIAVGGFIGMILLARWAWNLAG